MTEDMSRAAMGSHRLQAMTAAALASVLLAAWLQWNVGGDTVTLYVDDIATAAAALLASLLCLRAGRRVEGRMRRFWWLLAAAAGAWALAEMTWGFYDLVLGDDVPVVSWADVGYLCAIPLAIAALVSHPALRGGGTRKVRSVIDALTVAVALLFLSWTAVLGPLWKSSDLSTLGGLVALTYPFGDVILVFFVVLAVRGMTRTDRLSLCCLLGGLLAMSLSDTLYAYLTGVNDYAVGGVLDVGWFAAYVGIALSALLARAREDDPARSAEEAADPPLASLVAPFFPLLIALGALAVDIQLGHRPERVGLVMAFGLVALVLLRQALLLFDLNQRDKRDAAGPGGWLPAAPAAPAQPSSLQGSSS